MPATGRPTTSDVQMRFISRAQDRLWRVWVVFGDFDSSQVYFSDKQYGSEQRALKAAIAYRDALVRRNKILMRVYAGNGFNMKHSRNTTGTVGIQLHMDTRTDPLRASWRSAIMREGRQVPMSRSIRRYGYVGAWQLVAAYRQAHTGQKTPLLPPEPTDELRQWAAQTGVALGLD
jgi:hypothetical protein